jgi:hypothetical protein
MPERTNDNYQAPFPELIRQMLDVRDGVIRDPDTIRPILKSFDDALSALKDLNYEAKERFFFGGPDITF